MLQQIHDTFWLAEGDLVDFHGFAYPTRSVIARLEDGGLWVWSPIRLTAELRAEVDRLGPVLHLVSPNKLHHLRLGDWKAAYPAAELWGPGSTIRKRRDLEFRDALGDAPPATWGEAIDQAWFRGSPLMDEIVFFHRPSRTAIVADLIQALAPGFLREHWSGWRRGLAWIDGLTQGQAMAPLEWRLSILGRGPARAARARVLAWPCERVIIAHGEWPRTGGAAFLARSLHWLGR